MTKIFNHRVTQIGLYVGYVKTFDASQKVPDLKFSLFCLFMCVLMRQPRSLLRSGMPVVPRVPLDTHVCLCVAKERHSQAAGIYTTPRSLQ